LGGACGNPKSLLTFARKRLSGGGGHDRHTDSEELQKKEERFLPAKVGEKAARTSQPLEIERKRHWRLCYKRKTDVETSSPTAKPGNGNFRRGRKRKEPAQSWGQKNGTTNGRKSEVASTGVEAKGKNIDRCEKIRTESWQTFQMSRGALSGVGANAGLGRVRRILSMKKRGSGEPIMAKLYGGANDISMEIKIKGMIFGGSLSIKGLLIVVARGASGGNYTLKEEARKREGGEFDLSLLTKPIQATVVFPGGKWGDRNSDGQKRCASGDWAKGGVAAGGELEPILGGASLEKKKTKETQRGRVFKKCETGRSYASGDFVLRSESFSRNFRFKSTRVG